MFIILKNSIGFLIVNEQKTYDKCNYLITAIPDDNVIASLLLYCHYEDDF